MHPGLSYIPPQTGGGGAQTATWSADCHTLGRGWGWGGVEGRSSQPTPTGKAPHGVVPSHGLPGFQGCLKKTRGTPLLSTDHSLPLCKCTASVSGQILPAPPPPQKERTSSKQPNPRMKKPERTAWTLQPRRPPEACMCKANNCAVRAMVHRMSSLSFGRLLHWHPHVIFVCWSSHVVLRLLVKSRGCTVCRPRLDCLVLPASCSPLHPSSLR